MQVSCLHLARNERFMRVLVAYIFHCDVTEPNRRGKQRRIPISPTLHLSPPSPRVIEKECFRGITSSEADRTMMRRAKFSTRPCECSGAQRPLVIVATALPSCRRRTTSQGKTVRFAGKVQTQLELHHITERMALGSAETPELGTIAQTKALCRCDRLPGPGANGPRAFSQQG